ASCQPCTKSVDRRWLAAARCRSRPTATAPSSSPITSKVMPSSSRVKPRWARRPDRLARATAARREDVCTGKDMGFTSWSVTDGIGFQGVFIDGDRQVGHRGGAGSEVAPDVVGLLPREYGHGLGGNRHHVGGNRDRKSVV